jgi:glycosyltransferase involved in cell wall biosynthesis
MSPKVAVIIPAYRCRTQIGRVLDSALAQKGSIHAIYVVDDACPENTGRYVEEHYKGRVTVITNEKNLGVGGAVLAGYARAVADGATVLVKIDGDGQMDPALVERFTAPLLNGVADYTKGNRFYSPRLLASMPLLRLLGNSALSFVAKAVTGYWHIMDPNNGYTALHIEAYRNLETENLDRRYFFETDMLFRLNTARAVVIDIPMKPHYGDETSSLSVGRVLLQFPPKYCNRLFKRLLYSYYLRDFSIGSVQIILGLLALGFGAAFGAYHWHLSTTTGIAATSGTVMVAAMPVILGFQLLLAALSMDVANVPRIPLQRLLAHKGER